MPTAEEMFRALQRIEANTVAIHQKLEELERRIKNIEFTVENIKRAR